MYLSPKRLRSGARVAIVAPASPFQSEELVAGLDVIRECGLEPVLGPNVKGLRTIDIHAAPLMDRVEELMWAFTDPSIDGIITVTGGMGSGETLPYLDYGRIREARKVLLGISDISALNNGILAGSGVITINGQYPSIRIDQGQEIRHTDSESLRLVLELMMSDQPWGDKPFEINQYLPRTVSPGRATGHVIGGNLDTFCTLLGTPFVPDVDGAIFFIEDTHKSGESIARLLIHCKLAGVFDRVAGVVVGEFYDVPKKEEPREPSIDDVIQQYLSSGSPCTYGYSFSHGNWTIPIPIGAQCTLDADTGEVSFDFTMGPMSSL
jgi:muramoyltetrapeptide carboxypeptidase